MVLLWTEGLAVGHPRTTRPRPTSRSWILSDPLSHKGVPVDQEGSTVKVPSELHRRDQAGLCWAPPGNSQRKGQTGAPRWGWPRRRAEGQLPNEQSLQGALDLRVAPGLCCSRCALRLGLWRGAHLIHRPQPWLSRDTALCQGRPLHPRWFVPARATALDWDV